MRELKEEKIDKLKDTIRKYQEMNRGNFIHNVTRNLPTEIALSNNQNIPGTEILPTFMKEIMKIFPDLHHSIFFSEPWITALGKVIFRSNWWPGKPLVIEKGENDLTKIKNNMEFGITDYYLVPSVSDFTWLVIFHHDMNIYLQGNEKLINKELASKLEEVFAGKLKIKVVKKSPEDISGQ